MVWVSAGPALHCELGLLFVRGPSPTATATLPFAIRKEGIDRRPGISSVPLGGDICIKILSLVDNAPHHFVG